MAQASHWNLFCLKSCRPSADWIPLSKSRHYKSAQKSFQLAQCNFPQEITRLLPPAAVLPSQISSSDHTRGSASPKGGSQVLLLRHPSYLTATLLPSEIFSVKSSQLSLLPTPAPPSPSPPTPAVTFFPWLFLHYMGTLPGSISRPVCHGKQSLLLPVRIPQPSISNWLAPPNSECTPPSPLTQSKTRFTSKANKNPQRGSLVPWSPHQMLLSYRRGRGEWKGWKKVS